MADSPFGGNFLGNLGSLFGGSRSSSSSRREPTFGKKSPALPGTDPNEAARYYMGQDMTTGSRSGDAYRRAQRGLGGATQEGLRLRDVEQSGIDEAKDMVRAQLPAIMESPLTDRDIGNQYAGMLEDIARMRSADMEQVTQYTGAAGLRGGVAADMVAQVELGALGQVSRGMRDLRTVQTQVEAQHKMTQLNAILGGGQMLAMAPSTMGYEALANIAEWYGGIYDVERGGEIAIKAAEAAGDDSIFGGALGGLGDIAEIGLRLAL